MEEDPVEVFVTVALRVKLVEPVIVCVVIDEMEAYGDELAVFDNAAVLVERRL